jgi:hypothetical protein
MKQRKALLEFEGFIHFWFRYDKLGLKHNQFAYYEQLATMLMSVRCLKLEREPRVWSAQISNDAEKYPVLDQQFERIRYEMMWLNRSIITLKAARYLLRHPQLARHLGFQSRQLLIFIKLLTREIWERLDKILGRRKRIRQRFVKKKKTAPFILLAEMTVEPFLSERDIRQQVQEAMVSPYSRGSGDKVTPFSRIAWWKTKYWDPKIPYQYR